MIRALLWLLLFTCVASAQPLDISDLPSDTQERLQKKFPQLQSAASDPATLDAVIRFLVVEEKFDSAEILRQTANGSEKFLLRVGKILRIQKLEFSGVKSFPEGEVRRLFGISEGANFDQQTLIEAAERVRSFYEGQGFAQARIDLEFHGQREPRQGGLRVKVRVNEGPQTTIQEIQIHSDNADFAKRLSRHLRGYRGEAVNEKTLSELRERVRDYLSRNHYFRAEIQDPQILKGDNAAKSILVYRFVNVEKYAVEMEGNQRESTSTLRGVLNLNEFTSSNPNVGTELASKIKSFYISRGYARAEVRAEEQPSSREKFLRVITLRIKEGPRVKMQAIEWSGRFSEKPEVYTDFVLRHSSEAVRDGYYVKEDIDVGLKNLITDRWNQGFLKARIVSTRTIFNAQKSEIRLQVNFDEGPLTQIRSISFSGVQQLTERELRDLLEFQEGEPLKLNRLEDSITKLKRHYQSKGFLEMSIINEKQDLVRYNADNTQVDVHFNIYEGPKVIVGSIVIEGNTITQDYVIFKELEFRYGDVLTPEAIEETTARLQRVGHFSSVEIRTLEEKTPTSIRTVLIRVVDRDPGLFVLGLGVNNERILTFRGYTGIAYRNIGGMGRGVSARIDAKYNDAVVKYPERSITLGYLEPYLFDSRMRGRLNLTQAFTVNDQRNDQGSELRQTTFTIEQDITSNMLFSWDVYSLARVRDFTIPHENELSKLDIASTGPTLDIDFRDHPFNPTRGTFTRVNLEYGSPGLGSNRTIEYIRSFASFTHYQSLGFWGLIWANSLRGGHLKNLSTQPDGAVPYDKKGFLLGGESTIRGFTPGEAFPNQNNFPASDFDALTNRYHLRSEATMYLIKTEFRFPIYKNLGGAIFYDGGAVFVKDNPFDRPYRDAFGIAARYNTPVGAVSLEYGWKINPRGDLASGGEAPSVFHFSIGTF